MNRSRMMERKRYSSVCFRHTTMRFRAIGVLAMAIASTIRSQTCIERMMQRIIAMRSRCAEAIAL